MGYSPWGHKESDMTEHTHAMSNTDNNEPESLLPLPWNSTKESKSNFRILSKSPKLTFYMLWQWLQNCEGLFLENHFD